MRRRRSVIPGVSLSLLDMLFSTFGGIILLSILFSALISELPVLENNEFYHASIRVSVIGSETDRPTPSEVRFLKNSESSDLLRDYKKGGFAIFNHSLDSNIIEDLSKYDSNLTVFIVRQKTDLGSGKYKTTDFIDISYIVDLGESLEDLFYIISYPAEFDLCDLSTDGILNIEIDEQLSDKRVREVKYLQCEQANALSTAGNNFLSPENCRNLEGCPRPVKWRQK